MLHFIFEHSGLIILILLAAIVLYFVMKVAIRAEQTRDKRNELMERVQRLKKKLDPDQQG